MRTRMISKALSVLMALAVFAGLLAAWQAAPALAGFTPTPVPTRVPALTSTPPEPTSSPQRPAKEPKDTPTPTIATGLTSTPGVLPRSGEEDPSPVLAAAMLLLGVVSLMVIGPALRGRP